MSCIYIIAHFAVFVVVVVVVVFLQYTDFGIPAHGKFRNGSQLVFFSPETVKRFSVL